MGLMDRMRRSAEELDKKNTVKPWHSSSYHRFFAGYTEYYVPRGDGGRQKIKRVYTGIYFRPQLTRRNRILIRLLYSALFILAIMMFYLNAMIPQNQDAAWITVVPVAVAIPALVMLCYALVQYVFAPPDMRIYRYNQAVIGIKRTSVISAVCFLGGALITAYFIITKPPAAPVEWWRLLRYAAGVAATFIIFVCEKRIVYDRVESKETVPPDGIEIS